MCCVVLYCVACVRFGECTAIQRVRDPNDCTRYNQTKGAHARQQRNDTSLGQLHLQWQELRTDDDPLSLCRLFLCSDIQQKLGVLKHRTQLQVQGDDVVSSQHQQAMPRAAAAATVTARRASWWRGRE